MLERARVLAEDALRKDHPFRPRSAAGDVGALHHWKEELGFDVDVLAAAIRQAALRGFAGELHHSARVVLHPLAPHERAAAIGETGGSIRLDVRDELSTL